MISTYCNKSINFDDQQSLVCKEPANFHHHQDCICAQMLLFLPSNKDHLSTKRILLLQIYHFLLSLNVLQLFQIFVCKQRICLLGCLFLFAHYHFHQFQGFTCHCMPGDLSHTFRFDFQNDGEKMRKKVLENEKMYEMSLMKKKAAISHYRLF